MIRREGTKKHESTEAEDQIDADLHFVMTRHTPENAEECAKELKENGDIIALEYVGADRKSRAAVTEIANRISELPKGEERAELEKWVEGKFANHPFYRKLLLSMAGSGKRIELIDISNEDPEWEGLLEEEERDFETNMKILFEHFEDAYAEYCQLIDDFAETVEAREVVVVRQLREMAAGENHPRISVFVGAAHTQPYINMRQGQHSGGERGRTFVPEDSEKNIKQRYSYKLQAMRHKHFFKDEELPHELVERAMLEHLIIGTVPSVIEMKSNTAEQEGYVLRALGALSGKEIQEVLTRIEEIKNKHVSFTAEDDDPDKDFSEYEDELVVYLESLLPDTR